MLPILRIDPLAFYNIAFYWPKHKRLNEQSSSFFQFAILSFKKFKFYFFIFFKFIWSLSYLLYSLIFYFLFFSLILQFI